MGGLGQFQSDVLQLDAWKTEPDYWEDTHLGLKIWAVRHPHFKTWCGYVEIPREHSLFGHTYRARILVKNRLEHKVKTGPIPLMLEAFKDTESSISMDCYFSVHYGITFAASPENLLKSPEGVEWAIGFDCAHCDDYCPVYEEELGLTGSGIYRDLTYVKENLFSLAQQVLDFTTCPNVLGVQSEEYWSRINEDEDYVF